MKRAYVMAASVAAVALLAGNGARAEATATPPLLDTWLSDHAVVQRGVPLNLAGWTAPSTVVRVAIDDRELSIEAGADGRWEVTVPPRPAGALMSVTVVGWDGRRAQAKDLLFGDVWLCSGQSNMDLAVGAAANRAKVMKAAERSEIRIMKIARTSAPTPLKSLTREIGWTPVNAESLEQFSSVCWHMGKELEDSVDAPIGLVQASWGGTSLLDWASSRAVHEIGGYDEDLALLAEFARSETPTRDFLAQRTESWAEGFDPGISQGWNKAEFGDHSWDADELPGLWEQTGTSTLGAFDGLVWFRKDFSIAPADAGKEARLTLGRIDERDTVWVNGVRIGGRSTSLIERDYLVPAGVLLEGENTIAVRVVDHKGSGGMAGPASHMALHEHSGQSKSLAGTWRYKASTPAREWPSLPPLAPWAAPRGLTTLYNGMIAPLKGMRIKGLAWYQGESDASESSAYAALLPVWLEDWRALFNDSSLPTIIVQLPGYGPLTTRPENARWAQLREVQRRFAARDPYAGLAVTIDLGTVDDIHPTYKAPVGARMAREALRLAYNRSEIAPPTQPVKVLRQSGTLIVQFNPEAKVHTVGGRTALGFELCSKSKCVFADASPGKEGVVLSAPDLDLAVVDEVRYAWQSSPIVNLYDAAGLPVVPFSITVD